MSTADPFQTLAHQLLDDLELRHDQLLAEIDSLSLRVDSVLSQYTTVKPQELAAAESDGDEDSVEDDA